MIKLAKIAFILLVSFITIKSYGQLNELGFGISNSTYVGDISPSALPNQLAPSAAIFFRKNTKDYSAALRGQLAYVNVKGNNSSENGARFYDQTLSFSNSLLELSVLGEYNFLDFSKRLSNSSQRVVFSPYVMGGIGGTYSIASSVTSGASVSSISPVIPIGVGMKFLLNPFWVLGVEVIARKTFTDKLDGINQDKFLSSSVGKSDLYYTAGLTLSYVFNGVNCPIKVYPKTKMKRNSKLSDAF
ncbi:MAG: DUF6089 family protein [Cyclobacteriaceae bacterium]